MAWFTTDDGRHVNTDWLAPADQLKYKQIMANKQIADQLNGITQTSGKQDLFQAPKTNASHNYNKRVIDGADEPEYERSPKMDWIDKRIEGKQKELEKLEKKMERINKAKESDYKENNPYYYSDYDFRSTSKDIENAKKSIQDYKDQMQKEIEKAKSRNVPVITDFLNDWEKRSVEYFTEQKAKYDEAAKIRNAKIRNIQNGITVMMLGSLKKKILMHIKLK